MMRKLLSAFIVAWVLMGQAITAQAGGGEPSLEQLTEWVVSLQGQVDSLQVKTIKLEAQLKAANARIAQLDAKLKWYEEVVFPAKWEQINQVASQLEGTINDLGWIYDKLVEVFNAISWFEIGNVEGIGEVVFVNAPVVFKDEADFHGETWYQQTVHFQKGFDGQDPVTADNFASSDLELTASLPWLIEKTKVSAALVPYMWEWAEPLMDVLYWYDEPNSGVDPYIEIQADVRTTGYAFFDGLVVNGDSTLNGTTYWLEWDENFENVVYHNLGELVTWADPLMYMLFGIADSNGNPIVVVDAHLSTNSIWVEGQTYLNDSIIWAVEDVATQITNVYSVSDWFLYLFKQFPDGPGPFVSGGGGGGGSAPTP